MCEQKEISIDESLLNTIADVCSERSVNRLKSYKIESDAENSHLITITFTNASVGSVSYLAGKLMVDFNDTGFDRCPNVVEVEDEIIWQEYFNTIDIVSIVYFCNCLFSNCMYDELTVEQSKKMLACELKK